MYTYNEKLIEQCANSRATKVLEIVDNARGSPA